MADFPESDRPQTGTPSGPDTLVAEIRELLRSENLRDALVLFDTPHLAD